MSDPRSHAGQIAHALPKGRKSGAGYVCCCPAHQDHNPSLSITERDGRLLVKCHGGCSQDAVVAALRNLGLWETRESEERRIVRTHDYVDAAGELLYQVIRYQPKDFRQRRPDGFGGWTWRMEGVHRVLYNLSAVVRNSIIFVVEGEKDVDTLADYGFVGTTAAGGAKAPWLPQFTEALRGREVIIVPDNDPPGLEKAARIAEALIGVADSVAVIELPPPHNEGRERLARHALPHLH